MTPRTLSRITTFSSLRIGFTGSRLGMSPRQLRRLEALIGERCPSELHHGQCIGADAQAHEIAMRLSVPAIIVHPPRDTMLVARLPSGPNSQTQVTYLPAARALRRNRAIVRAVDLLVAAPASSDETVRSGTWSTIRFARRLPGVSVVILAPV